jgi:hypothetical protein
MRYVGIACIAFVFVIGCTAEQTEEGELPDVDLSADPGQLPQYDVDPATVRVGTDTQKVVTPDIDVVPAGQDTTRQKQ